jgi:hypothetical protein
MTKRPDGDNVIALPNGHHYILTRETGAFTPILPPTGSRAIRAERPVVDSDFMLFNSIRFLPSSSQATVVFGYAPGRPALLPEVNNFLYFRAAEDATGVFARIMAITSSQLEQRTLYTASVDARPYNGVFSATSTLVRYFYDHGQVQVIEQTFTIPGTRIPAGPWMIPIIPSGPFNAFSPGQTLVIGASDGIHAAVHTVGQGRLRIWTTRSVEDVKVPVGTPLLTGPRPIVPLE